MDKTNKHTTRNAVLAAIVLAMASLGDSFLYAYLPANHEQLGISALWVGILLSVNRFTRLFLNGWVAYGLNQLGTRNVTIIAVGFAMLTTISYGFIDAILFLLFMRIAWGISFSALRLSSIVYAVQHHKKGIALGLSKSIVAIGPVLALFIGPLLLNDFGRSVTFLVLGGAGLLAVGAAILLPELEMLPVHKKELRLSAPSSLNVQVLLSSLIVDGVMVVMITAILSANITLTLAMLISITAFYLGYRRICLVIFSPLAGWLADKWGFEYIFRLTTLAMIFGIVVVLIGYPMPGLIITFTFSGMNAAIGPGAALKNDDALLKEISDNATWRDIGAAIGTLIGALFLGTEHITIILAASAILLIGGLAWHYSLNHQKSILWK